LGFTWIYNDNITNNQRGNTDDNFGMASNALYAEKGEGFPEDEMNFLRL
jgi:hypothetical protein